MVLSKTGLVTSSSISLSGYSGLVRGGSACPLFGQTEGQGATFFPEITDLESISE